MMPSAALADGLGLGGQLHTNTREPSSPPPSTLPLRRFSTSGSTSPASSAAVVADHDDVANVATAAGTNTNGRLLLARFLALASPPHPPPPPLTSSSSSAQKRVHAYTNNKNSGQSGGGTASLSTEGKHTNHRSSVVAMTDDSNNKSSYHHYRNSNSMGDDLIIENDDNDNELFSMQQYEICETIDESMSGLHNFPSTTTATTNQATDTLLTIETIARGNAGNDSKETHHPFDYDWILDGSDDSEMDNDNNDDDDDDDDEDTEFNNILSSKPRRRRRRDFGDAALDLMLGKMELESSASSYAATSTNNSSVSNRRRSSDSCGDGGNAENTVEVVVSTDEEMVEFGDFSSADFGGVFDGDVDNVEPNLTDNNIDRKEEVVCNSIEIEESVTSTGMIPHISSSDVNGIILSSTMASEEEASDDSDEVEECKPPQSIECLVSDLNAELDAAISNCLHSSPDKSNGSSSEASSLQDGNDSDSTSLMEVLNEEKPQQAPMKPFPQSLLMSSLLMESLPIPMPSSLSDDPVASFTRRMQKHHMELHDVDAAHSTVQIQDEQLEQKLSDTIHHGYFDNAEEDDTDHYDPIVMEEIMNVPWPFHVLDLNESFLNDEDCDDDLNSDEKSIDDLHFDTYIANRLTELDSASGEIMDCLLSRVYQQEDAINNGVEIIFAAELSISTAILYSNSCREFLHRARDGYHLSSIQHDLSGHHNVITSSVDVLRIADCKDRLQYLLATVDEISSIFDKEARWMQDVKTNMISHHRFQMILDDAKMLIDLAPREEVLNQISCLHPLRDRLNSLPEVLQKRVEESLALLFSRALHSDENKIVAFDEICLEYESFLTAWLSCGRMMTGNNQSAQQSHLSAIEMAWAGCISNIFCFETKKAVSCSIIDFHRERPSTGTYDSAMEEILLQLNQTRFNVTGESTLESSSQRLMRFGGGHNSSALSSPFFHLCSRLVEVMNLYDMTLQWLESLIAKAESANEPPTFMLPLTNEYGISQSDKSLVSSVSSEKQLSSSADEASKEDNVNEEISSSPLPEDIEFSRYHCCSTSDEYKSILKATRCIRRAIWDHCEMALIQLIDVYLSIDTGVASGESTDSVTRNFHSTYAVLLQFTAFSTYFLGEDEDDESKQCTAVESELSKLYLKHLRSVHVEAMKTTGTILRHEAWQLAPLELPRYASTTIEKDCKCIYSQQSCALCKETIIRSVYQAVGDLLLGSVHDNIKSEHRRLITTRSEHSGYRRLISFEEFLDNSANIHSDTIQQLPWRVQGCGMISNEFTSAVLPFVEMNACGERTISILTQSSSNGLMRWTTRLLAIGNALPLVAKDASAAVMTLIDLYILTVFRFCAGSKLNEDVLIGFGRGTAASSAASTSGSLTMEADAVAPLLRDRRVIGQTQEFIASSRNRLKDIVNLDKFQSSSDTCTTPPRSNNVVPTFARRLEKEAAAACSCFFVAVLVDVASTIFNDGKDQLSEQQPLWADLKDLVSSSEKPENCNDLKHYAAKFVAVVPTLVAQTTRFATVNSISGKELVFKIMCCGRTFENRSMQEQSNAYVDDLCERSASLWGHLSSSTRLPPPALHYTWNHLVWSAFMLLLEGFSKVNCSMEGRSLMSMDLATLSHGLMPETVMGELEDDYSAIGPPPQSCREGMMRYVDAFIKVFYFPNEDVLSWVTENAKTTTSTTACR